MVRQPIGPPTHWSENPWHWSDGPLVESPFGPKGTCVEFGPTQLPVGLGLGLGLRLALGLGLGLRLGLGLGLGLRLELGLGLGPNLIDRKLGGPEPDTSAVRRPIGPKKGTCQH